ncbi:MAG TPA: alkaline phosphatase family protein [Acidimicrobiales bacterium]|nr:alkaline phosphatase family protein [Acidimicrobiales bacterium]
MKTRWRTALAALMAIGFVTALLSLNSSPSAAATSISPSAPIKHVVILYQENHTFDNVLGALCVADNRCDGATSAKLSTGQTYVLTQANDNIPNVSHSTKSQQKAIDGGKMDQFDRIVGCTKAKNYACLSQFAPSQIPNLAALARNYVISDRTFQMDRVLSWGAHLELVTSDLDGFDGEIPSQPSYAPKLAAKYWGCNGNKVTGWQPTPAAAEQQVPACVPRPDGTGTFWDRYGPSGSPQTSPVKTVPTILDSLNNAGKTWKMYLSEEGFDICSYVAKCHDSSQQTTNVVKTNTLLTDASNGKLPDLSIVLPNGPGGNTSQHNNASMAVGDNWIGQAVNALLQGPEANSTAVFITYDDCGCFYDHVPPPSAQLGLRVPMVIVSPWVKKGFTDSTPTSFIGMMTFTEHLFGLPALTSADANAYDYANSFDFTQSLTTAKFKPQTTQISQAEQQKLAANPPDPDDPT